MTKEEILELEYLFNHYSFRFELFKDERDNNGMENLRGAVTIFGHKFVEKEKKEIGGIVYSEYKLVKINE